MDGQRTRHGRPFRLCWQQHTTNQIYYRDAKINSVHSPSTASAVQASEVIAHGADILNSSGKISKATRELIEDHPAVQQAWGSTKGSIFLLQEQDSGANLVMSAATGETFSIIDPIDGIANSEIIFLFTAKQRPTHHWAGIRIGEANN